ncbi:hypothetical protein [Rhodococcus sp. IEGM 1330]|uniref:hypothetical protein n=1 Tax=Rhodococcus sp. IEGM 1330 TaxID=3082225 RepID=UPI002952B1CD|nr:hypothetical protein [Rhodococcus sp. IEGM 1330]MDV8024226.1 hypothetical protein [Rhodococcus sp. IEGM 1330]
MSKRWWGLVIAAAITVALVSLASNITSESQLSAQANTVLAVRSTLSKLVNSGAVWAGLPILSGWLVRRPLHAFAAGIVASLLALVVHYGVGQLLGMFDVTVWAGNRMWFALALVMGGPLGLIGVAARGGSASGLIARLVVPAGAMIEPFFRGMFSVPTILPWPERVASVAAGVVLVAAGIVGAAVLIRQRRKQFGAQHRSNLRPTASEQTSSIAPPVRRFRPSPRRTRR